MNHKKITLVVIGIFSLIVSSYKVNAQSNCCPAPDSLTITTLTDSIVCFKWKIYDSLGVGCDTPRKAILQYRRVNTTTWKTDTVKYLAGNPWLTKCDTVSPCTRYQWRVRNECSKNGNTTYSEWVSADRFKTPCDTTGKHSSQQKISVYPNPAYNMITVQGKFYTNEKLVLQVTDMNGIKKAEKNIPVNNSSLNVSFDISGWNKGIYFVVVTGTTTNIKYSFIKQ